MEITVEQPALNMPIYASLQKLFPEEQEGEIYKNTLEFMWTRPNEKACIWERLAYLSNALATKLQINPEYPPSFQGLCDTARISLSIIGNQVRVDNPIAEIAISHHQRTLFLLYTTFTWNSFIDFPCGSCFSLKYEYYKYIQGKSNGCAISASQIREIGLKCVCGADASEAILLSCTGEDYTQCIPKAADVAYACVICHRECKERLPGLCQSHNICYICAGKNYMSANYEFTLCCQVKLTDSNVWMCRQAIAERYLWMIQWMSMVKHDKRLSNLQFAHLCGICGAVYVSISERACEDCKAYEKSSLSYSAASPINASLFELAELCPKCRKHLTNGLCNSCQGIMPDPRYPSSASMPRPAPDPSSGTLNIPREQYSKYPRSSKQLNPLDQSGSKDLHKSAAIEESKAPKGEDTNSGKLDRSNPGNSAVAGGNHSVKREEGRMGTRSALDMEERKRLSGEEMKGDVQRSRNSGRIERQSGQLQRSGSGIVPKRTSCIVCQANYTKEDNVYFCPGACRCRLCLIEGVTGEMTTCKYCHKDLSLEVNSLVNRGRKRCHICWLAVEIEELEADSPCTICCRCVSVCSERSWIGLKKAKGQCRIHPSNTFDIDKDYYTALKLKIEFDQWACCPRASRDDRRLACGHNVCAVHQEHLRFCRKCQSPVNQPQPG